MNRTVLTSRQENLLVAAISIAHAAAQPGRRLPGEVDNYVFDEHVNGWFNRTLAGTRTPEPATYDELAELYKLLNSTGLVALETA